MAGRTEDTATLRLEIEGSALSGDVKIAGAPGNGIVVLPDGLYVAALPVASMVRNASSTPPLGWMTCDGGTASRLNDAALFAAVGTRYGAGNGSTTFNVPSEDGWIIKT
jgi:hypothetical protein